MYDAIAVVNKSVILATQIVGFFGDLVIAPPRKCLNAYTDRKGIKHEQT